MRLLCVSKSEYDLIHAIFCVLFVASGFSLGAEPRDSAGAGAIQFNRDIAPILAANCYACHGPDKRARKAGLRLDQREVATVELKSGHVAIVPGESDISELIRRVTSTDDDARMPPPDVKSPLSKEQIDLLRRWIDEGARWRKHWSLIPPQSPEIPAIEDDQWAKNPIDHFILRRLTGESLSPSPPADKRTLIRRVTLDLTGLPPTMEEVKQFLADDRPDAYERVVDRLLTSPRYGERMAMFWMDAARFSDTYGYHEDYPRQMWPYRDWVIRAFNDNMPYDQFTVEQLAGDLLPNATVDQKVATGFNRLHGLTSSGIAAEYRVESVTDRVETTATIWMGLTMGCARCHDHKYDPITQKEFYEFSAFFNTCDDPALLSGNPGNVEPLIRVMSEQERENLDAANEHIARIKTEIEERSKSASALAAQWEAGLTDTDRSALNTTAGLVVHIPFDETNVTASSDIGHIQSRVVGDIPLIEGQINRAASFDNGSFVDVEKAVAFDRDDPFSYGAWIKPLSGGAVIARMDESDGFRGFDLLVTGDGVEIHLIHRWPDDAIRLYMNKPLDQGQWHHLMVTYDGTSKAEGVKFYVDGEQQPVDITHDSLNGTIRTDKPLHIGRRSVSAFFHGAIDDVRIYDRALAPNEVTMLVSASEVLPLLSIRPESRNEAQQQSLEQYYLQHHDENIRQLKRELGDQQSRAQQIIENAPTTMIMREMAEPRDTFVLNRGDYQQPTEKVQAGTPASLSPLTGDRPADRLALAQWLMEPGHPLTSRVAVNHLWQIPFGRGLVATSEDFGVQGSIPTHPGLLDWLACEYVRSGWDTRHMLKVMVFSATYRQSSVTSDAMGELDPENRLYGRGPRHRLTAEMVRDQALAVSGLLVEKVGGPSVKPYQPAGLWREMVNATYEQDHGDALYRRSLYTYRKRSVPPPNMTAFDAPSRETCAVRRQRTNTPLMALVLMNDPTFVEASRALAQRMMTEAADRPEAKVDFAFELATSRKPDAQDRDVLLKLFQRQHNLFSNSPQSSVDLLSVGESPRDGTLDAATHAAWTVVANVILNMDETITKE